MSFIPDTEIALRNSIEGNFSKAVLLSAASYFEYKITNDLTLLMNELTDNNSLVVEFIKKKALEREYHKLFNWEANNANRFYKLFGDLFLKYMQFLIDQNQQLEESVKAFLEIGRERNRLVHQNYSTFPMEKTTEEIYLQYTNGLFFVTMLPLKFREFNTLVKRNELRDLIKIPDKD